MKYTTIYRPPTIVFDIDGTLVNTTNIQHFLTGETADFDRYNDEAYHCPPIPYVLRAADEARLLGFRVIQLTARCVKYIEHTERWLEENEVPSDGLYMRKENDFRSDVEVKKDFIDQLLKVYDIKKAFDDKPEIVALWEDYDIPCVRIYPEEHNGAPGTQQAE